MAKLPDRVRIIMGDITQLPVEAIVNAANNALCGGGGVDGAIHRAAGPGLLNECRQIGYCPTGEARITHGYNLPARWVIHTVGPVWSDGIKNEEELLAQCYRSCFSLAETHKIKSIAFPSISTGAYRFPIEKASRIALTEVQAWLATNPATEQIILVCFREPDYRHYLEAAEEIFI